jgi:sec-independent protein translocase protein TatA
MTPTMLATLSPTHIILVVAVLLLLFGAQKIPALMRSMGSGLSEFKKGLKEGEESLLSGAAKKDASPAETTSKPG